MHYLPLTHKHVATVVTAIFPAIFLCTVLGASQAMAAQPSSAQAAPAYNLSGASRAELVQTRLWRLKMNNALAPIHSRQDLEAYLKITANQGSPLDSLLPSARKRFLASLVFTADRLGGYSYIELQHLDADQIYSILALFGRQSDTPIVSDSSVTKTASSKRVRQALRGYRCLPKEHVCIRDFGYICICRWYGLSSFNFSQVPTEKLKAETSWRLKMDDKLALIHSRQELKSYLKLTDNSQSPLDALPISARKRFISSLEFTSRGLSGYSYADLQYLKPTQVYRILSLFGVQRDTPLVARPSGMSPKFFCLPGLDPSCPGDGGGDHKDYACLSKGTCIKDTGFICTDNC